VNKRFVAACRPPGGSRAQYATTRATRGKIVQSVTASGSISALVSVEVGSQVSGKIAHLYADFNSQVAKGQVIAQIDEATYKAALQQAAGDLASARATVVLKRQNLARKKTLVPMHAASQLDLDQAVAELAQAEASVVIKEAALRSARTNVEYCRITAPVSGVVISRKVDEGQTVIAAMTTPVLFTVAEDLTHMNIKADVSEADIGLVRVGQPVEFTVDAFADQSFAGTVAQVRRSPTTNQNVVTYETVISIENSEQRLFPGMTADVSIRVAERNGALKIPNSALRYSPPDDVSFEEMPARQLRRSERLVYVLAAHGLLRPVAVRPGITDGTETEILDGLTDGTAVVTATISARKPSSAFGPPRENT
jgi:HlyD family secretion protein